MVSERKKQLIYGCAAEAVTKARIEIEKNLRAHGLERHEIARQIDCVLSQAQHNAGKWALDALDTDTRVYKHARQITG